MGNGDDPFLADQIFVGEVGHIGAQVPRFQGGKDIRVRAT